MTEAIKKVRTSTIALALLGLVWPTPALGDLTAPVGKTPNLGNAPTVHDIRLDAQGSLQIVVVDAQGRAMPASQVHLTRSGKNASTIGVTDRDGRHTFRGLTGGVYQLHTDQGVCLCRVWTSQAAPPTAKKSLLIINDRLVQRGQRPIREMFRSDPILMTAIVAAAIAIPIAIHQSRDNSPGS